MQSSPSSSKRRVLVVDDLEPLRASLARALRVRCSVATAPGAHAALKLLAAESFDAVLTDNSMPPGPDGVWLLGEVQRLYPRVRRFLMSGEPQSKFAQHVTSGLIEMSFHKPTSGAAFIRALEG